MLKYIIFLQELLLFTKLKRQKYDIEIDLPIMFYIFEKLDLYKMKSLSKVEQLARILQLLIFA